MSNLFVEESKLIEKGKASKPLLEQSSDNLDYIFRPASKKKQVMMHEITSLLEDDPVQDGYSHPLEDLLKNYIQDTGHEAVSWIQDIFVDKISSQPLLAADILNCLGRLEPSIALSSGLLMTYLALAQSSICLREAGLRLIENWNLNHESVRTNLESFIQKESKPWLSEYASEILMSLPH